MDYKNLLTGVISALVIGTMLIVFMGVGSDGRDGINGLDGRGAIPGPDVYNRMYFHNGYQSGGTLFATTSAAGDSAYTLLASDIDRDVTYIEWNTGVNITITTMASSSMGFLGGNAGDERSYWFYSATGTAAATITFAAGTGVDGQEVEGSDLVVNGGELALITFIRKSNTDVLFLLQVMQTD